MQRIPTIARAGLAAIGATAVLVAIPAGAAAADKFGADLKNSDGSVTQPTAERNCQQDANALDSTKECDRIAVKYQDTGAIQGNITAPHGGKIDKLKLVALHKGKFQFELGRTKNYNGGDNGKGQIVAHSRHVKYESSIKGTGYKIQTFDIPDKHVDKGDYLAIKARKTSLLKCQSGSTEQLLFQPPLAVNAPFTGNAGHVSNCTLLLQAVYK